MHLNKEFPKSKSKIFRQKNVLKVVNENSKNTLAIPEGEKKKIILEKENQTKTETKTSQNISNNDNSLINEKLTDKSKIRQENMPKEFIKILAEIAFEYKQPDMYITLDYVQNIEIINKKDENKNLKTPEFYKYRSGFIYWISMIQLHFKMPMNAMLISIAIFDRYHNITNSNNPYENKITFATCLFLGCKLYKYDQMKINQIKQFVEHEQLEIHIKSCEIDILMRIDFHTEILTPIDFLGLIIKYLKINSRQYIYKIYYLIEIALISDSFASAFPNLTACVCLATFCMINFSISTIEDFWEADLIFITGYRATELEPKITELLKILNYVPRESEINNNNQSTLNKLYIKYSNYSKEIHSKLESNI